MRFLVPCTLSSGETLYVSRCKRYNHLRRSLRSISAHLLHYHYLNIMSKDYIPPKSVEQAADEVEKNAFSHQSKIYASKRLSKFFEIEVKLKIFGNVVRVWAFPPNN